MTTIPNTPHVVDDLRHPRWCASDRCTAPDRLLERGVEEREVPLSRRSSHFSRAHTIPTSRVSEVQVTFELFRDVYTAVTDEPDGVLFSYHSEVCGHGGTLVFMAEQMAPMATIAAKMRDAVRSDRTPISGEVARALRVLGCVDRGNAEALISLTTVHLSPREHAAVLGEFPAGGEGDR